MPTTRKTAAADAADEAQQPTEPPADTTGGSQEKATPAMQVLRDALKVSEQRILGELRPITRDLASRLDNLEALDEASGSTFVNMTNQLNDLAATVGGRLDEHEHVIKVLNDQPRTVPTSELFPAAGLGAARKVLAVMRLVTEIGKGRQADMGQGGNYAFRGVDDAMNVVGAALREVGLIMRQQVLNVDTSEYFIDKTNKEGVVWGRQQWSTTRITMRYVFVDPDDGSEHAVEGYGVGKDVGDKDGSKAAAAAMKYALFQGLCIPVKGMNIDPETDHPDSGDERHAPEDVDQTPPAPPKPEQLAMTLLAWAQKPGLKRAQLDHQINEADARGLLNIELSHPQTGFRTTLIEHLNPIRHMLPEE